MHSVIRILCFANNKEEARERAEKTLNESLVDEGCPFDYGTFFDDDKATMSGKARWGNLPPVSLADSKEGKKLIDGGYESHKRCIYGKT